MIRQLHVSECDSTQDLLKEQLTGHSSEDTILVSCDNQRQGRGRGENKWQTLPGTVCFSLNIKPHKVMSYTALEISVLLARYFELQGARLKLKWPNDLWNEDLKKCAGILVQGSGNFLLAGIGLNLTSDDPAFGGVFKNHQAIEPEKVAFSISEFLLNHRYQSTDELRKDWLSRCGHLNDMVIVSEGNERVEGIFQGLGDYGEALVCHGGQTQRLFNGSLRLSSIR